MTDTFSKHARLNGVITELTKEVIVITYEDGTKEGCELGLKLGTSEGSLYRHTLITDLKVGDKVSEGMPIAWDTEWFERDRFCNGQLVVKTGRMVRAVFTEDQTVYEDSLEIYKELAEEFVTPVPVPVSFLVDIDKTIRFKKKVGDKVEFDSILCEISDAYIDSFLTEEDDVSEANKYGIKQIKTSYYGEVVGIEVVYNANEDEMSETIKALVNEHNKKQFRIAKLLGKGPSTVRIGTGINVKKPSIPFGSVKITFIVESLNAGAISDKYVYGNQMKGTNGHIVNKQMFTEDGRPCPLKFSFKSMFKRMVISLRNKAAVNEWLFGVKNRFINIYRGKTK